MARFSRDPRLVGARAAGLGGEDAAGGGPPFAADWLDRITGSFKDDPAFEEVLEYGRAFRRSDRPSEDEESRSS